MVQYYDNDFSFEEHRFECEQILKQTTFSSPSSDNFVKDPHVEDDDDIDNDNNDTKKKLNPITQSQCWDDFHTTHSHGNFFKPRRYILKCFPCILDHVVGDDNNNNTSCQEEGRDCVPSNHRVVLEIGCGSGSSCLPILKHCYNTTTTTAADDDTDDTTKILACDCSAVAVEVCRSVIEKEYPGTERKVGVFVSDPSLDGTEADTTFVQDVKDAYTKLVSPGQESSVTHTGEGLADVVLMVFVLSAVPPERVSRFMQQVHNVTKKGGKVCFRDYALYDLPMMRFKERHCVHSTLCLDVDGVKPRLFERGDGTLSRFFDLETVQHIFESVGFVMEELRYATVYNDNRKTGERLKRAFVHAVFCKP